MINKKWSPLGEALLDYFNGNEVAVIKVISSVEEDQNVPVTAFFRDKNKLPKIEKLALSCCKGKVLDIGAGAGTHSLILQENGFDITAMDISEEAAEVMRKRGLKKVIAADIFNYHPEEKYDTLLMLMNGIGLAADLPGLERFFIHAKTLLNNGGQIILDSSDLHYVTPDMKARATIKPNTVNYYGIIWYQLEYKGKRGDMYSWLFADQETLKEKAKNAGFKTEILFDEDDHYLVCLSM